LAIRGGDRHHAGGQQRQVKALVYVTAFAPDSGQSANDIQKDCPRLPGSRGTQGAAGFLTLSDKGIAEDFAPDVSPAQARLLAATQEPWFSVASARRLITRVA